MALRPEINAHSGISYPDSFYVEELYSKNTLRNFYKNTVYKDICNMDHNEIATKGSKIKINSTPSFTPVPYTIGKNDITYAVPDAAGVELEIDQGLLIPYQIEDVNAFQESADIQRKFAEGCAKDMGVAVDQNVLHYMALQAAATNQGTTAGAVSGSIDLGSITGAGASEVITSANAVDKLVHLGQALSENNVGPDGRWVLLPHWYCSLLAVGDLRRADITNDGQSVIRNGLRGEIHGMKVYESNNLLTASDGDAATSTYVSCGTSEATTFAAQIDKVESGRMETSMASYFRLLMVFGRKTVQPAALSTLICKPA